MRFDRDLGSRLWKGGGAIVAALAITLGVLHGCGQKGDSDFPNTALQFFSQNDGCLNDFGKRAGEFVAGELLPYEWESSCDCVIESMRLFKRYLRGTHPEGYTPEDIRVFVSRFLLTDRPLSPELVSITFELKASILGGSPTVLTKGELDRLIQLFSIVKRETVKWIPHLLARSEGPTPENLNRLGAAIQTGTARIAEQIDGTGHPAFTRESAQKLGDELSKLFGWPIPAETSAWVGAGKSLLLGGSPDAMEGAAWANALRVTGELAGPAIAILSLEHTDRLLIEKLGLQIRSTLQGSARAHGAAIPLSAVDRFLETVPIELIATDRTAWKKAMRPLSERVLKSQTRDAIDVPSLDRLFEVALRWNRRELHLDGIFKRLGADPSGASADEIARAAQSYAKTQPEDQRVLIDEVTQLARRYRPLFMADDPQITFTRWNRLSRFHLSQMNWIRLAAEYMIQGYASMLDGDKVAVEGFRRIMSDFGELLFALGRMDTTVPSFDLKRFREANLFTFDGNGDTFIDLHEATYFLAIANSGGVLTDRIKAHLEKTCQSLGPDHMGGQLYDAKCFRKEYFYETATFWDHFPQLAEFYSKLDNKGQMDLQLSIERAARPYGASDKPITTADLQGFATFPHYIEALLLRVDANSDARVDLSEALTIFPVFQEFLAEVGCIDPTDTKQLEAVFTFTIKHQHPPEPTAGGIAQFLAWRATKPFWKLDADRLAIYTTIGILNDPSSSGASACGR